MVLNLDDRARERRLPTITEFNFEVKLLTELQKKGDKSTGNLDLVKEAFRLSHPDTDTKLSWFRIITLRRKVYNSFKLALQDLTVLHRALVSLMGKLERTEIDVRQRGNATQIAWLSKKRLELSELTQTLSSIGQSVKNQGDLISDSLKALYKRSYTPEHLANDHELLDTYIHIQGTSEDLLFEWIKRFSQTSGLPRKKGNIFVGITAVCAALIWFCGSFPQPIQRLAPQDESRTTSPVAQQTNTQRQEPKGSYDESAVAREIDIEAEKDPENKLSHRFWEKDDPAQKGHRILERLRSDKRGEEPNVEQHSTQHPNVPSSESLQQMRQDALRQIQEQDSRHLQATKEQAVAQQRAMSRTQGLGDRLTPQDLAAVTQQVSNVLIKTNPGYGNSPMPQMDPSAQYSPEEIRSLSANFIGHWEAFVAEPYFCSEGYLTIGYGSKIDLHRSDKTEDETIRVRLRKLGLAQYEDAIAKVKSKKDLKTLNFTVTPEIAQAALYLEIEDAYRDALFFADFANLPADIQIILLDMAYNVGGTEIRTWNRTNKIVASKDWATLSKTFSKFKWYKQTGRRSLHHVQWLKIRSLMISQRNST